MNIKYVTIDFAFCGRAKEREKLRQKKLVAKMSNTPLGPSRKILKNTKMATSNCKVSVVIDLSFDDLMDERVREIESGGLGKFGNIFWETRRGEPLPTF
jgi:hypothetical protein